MTCPVCGGNTNVVDSRKDIDHVIRCRKCVECEHRFYTIETDCDLHKRLKKGKRKNDDTED